MADHQIVIRHHPDRPPQTLHEVILEKCAIPPRQKVLFHKFVFVEQQKSGFAIDAIKQYRNYVKGGIINSVPELEDTIFNGVQYEVMVSTDSGKYQMPLSFINNIRGRREAFNMLIQACPLFQEMSTAMSVAHSCVCPANIVFCMYKNRLFCWIHASRLALWKQLETPHLGEMFTTMIRKDPRWKMFNMAIYVTDADIKRHVYLCKQRS